LTAAHCSSAFLPMLRGVVVRVRSKATSLAKERLLRLPIGLLTMPTARARPAGVSRVDQMHWHAGPACFVGEELAQLEERPGMPRVAKFASNRYSLLRAQQAVEGECLARYGGFLGTFLADTVVGVALEAGLAPSHATNTALGV